MFFTSRPARQLAFGAILLGFATLTACDKLGGSSDAYAKTQSGIEYKIYKKVGNKYERRELNPTGDPTYKNRVGKFITAHLQYLTGKDSVLQNTRRDVKSAVPLPLTELKQKGTPEEAFSLLQPGDSGIFRFQGDSLFNPKKGRPAPPFIKRGGNVVIMTVATEKLIDEAAAMALQQELQQKMMAEQQKKMLAESAGQLQKDDVILQEYIKKNNLTMQKDPSGIYYQITKQGTGPVAKAGQTVSVNYMGTLLTGKMFDSSDKVGKPFDFPLGQGQVIPGWDKGIALLNKGSKAILLIPSALAYGQRGAGADIPADASLRFEVELVNIK